MSILIFGFSIAGKNSGTLPAWITILRIISSTAGIISAAFVVSAFTNGWAGISIEIAGLTGMLWFLSVGIVMVIKGSQN